ncbi:MAG: hypothetical protein K8F91_17720, partial [Candidatus Obscuribacterales bacterium]|nr:hypothetical protein [Candidatus Obscuribacterales bacterium]
DVDGEQTGELFEYKIKDPVSVPRDSSALIPVVQQFIEGERVSLYKEERNKDFPYSAVRLINTTGLTLEAGPITVMDTNSYAGECLLDVLKPDDKRILPYALDQSVSVVVRQDFEKRPIWKVQIVDGVMVLHHKQTSKKRYLLENLSSGKKIVYVEYPYQDGWKLAIGEEAEEITRNFYRFRVELSEKETCELNVTLESDAVESYSPFAINAEHHQIQWLLKQNFVDETLLAFLKKGLVVKGELDRLTNEVHRIEAEIAGEEQNQFRARENVKTLGANAGRFKESIEQSEDRIVALQQKLKKERSDAFVKEKELKDLFRQNLESELNKSTPAKV